MTTKIINLLASPCKGKSSLSHSIVGEMKKLHLHVEHVSEYPKELVYSGRLHDLSCQPAVFGRMLEKIWLLYKKVDYIVVDGSLLLSAVYGTDVWPASFQRSVIDIYNSFNNLNFYLQGSYIPYNPEGRLSEHSQRDIDSEILRLLVIEDIKFISLPIDTDRVSTILNYVLHQ